MSTKNSSILTKKYRLVLSAVHMVYRLVNSTFNAKELVLRLTRLLCQFIHANSSSVLILDPSKKKVGLIAVFNNKINYVIDKKGELARIGSREKRVLKGATIFTQQLMGVPLVADDIIGAIFIRRQAHEPAFNHFDYEMLSVFAEQSVTALKNLQLYEQQQNVLLGSIKFFGKLTQVQKHYASVHTPVYSKIMKALAAKLKFSNRSKESLQYASLMHEAGVLDIPYELLKKTSRLTPEEFKTIREHPAKSVGLIKPVEFLKPVLPIILYHHEKYDGTGYPLGLKGEQIPVEARVMAVVDAFEAMICRRSYQKPRSIDGALAELLHNRGSQFDPRIVDVFLKLSQQKKFRKYLCLIHR